MPQPRELLAQWISGYWLSQMLHVAARLKLADLIAAGTQSSAALAAATGMHEPSLFRLLRALASIGVFAETTPRTFALTPLAELLKSNHPESVRPMALMLGGVQYEAWADLYDCVETGRPAFDERFGQPLFSWLAERPVEAAEFDAAMTAIHGRETAATIEAYDFSRYPHLVDVGGGNGSQLLDVLRALPEIRGTVFDLPGVVDRTRSLIAEAGFADRCDAVGGSFFEEAPAGADGYVLRHIIHDWNDEQSLQILRTVRNAATESSRLIVIESVIPEGNGPGFAKLLDLTMLVIPGGKERTAEEYRTLFAEAGWELTSITPTTADVSVLEGKVVGG